MVPDCCPDLPPAHAVHAPAHPVVHSAVHSAAHPVVGPARHAVHLIRATGTRAVHRMAAVARTGCHVCAKAPFKMWLATAVTAGVAATPLPPGQPSPSPSDNVPADNAGAPLPSYGAPTVPNGVPQASSAPSPAASYGVSPAFAPGQPISSALLPSTSLPGTPSSTLPVLGTPPLILPVLTLPSAQNIPEPGTVVLYGVGVIALGAMRVSFRRSR